MPARDEELRTERLTLRRPILADIDAILAVHSDPLACAHNPSDALATRADAESLFARWDEHWRCYGFGYWVLRRHDSPAQLGFCGLKFMEFRARRILNLFYRLAPASWGKGMAGEAARAVVGWATERMPGHPVIARVRPENLASQRVAARTGLARAVSLDEEGHDGFDWIYATGWPEPAH
ncbi:MAG TPA: GNAT family N-acetyltransferase [Actinophytocola sp.]|nr:GNAT family N-acetyltransferase [Actinophytocola sp.]